MIDSARVRQSTDGTLFTIIVFGGSREARWDYSPLEFDPIVPTSSSKYLKITLNTWLGIMCEEEIHIVKMKN